jgi:hypothetical protein
MARQARQGWRGILRTVQRDFGARPYRSGVRRRVAARNRATVNRGRAARQVSGCRSGSSARALVSTRAKAPLIQIFLAVGCGSLSRCAKAFPASRNSRLTCPAKPWRSRIVPLLVRFLLPRAVSLRWALSPSRSLTYLMRPVASMRAAVSKNLPLTSRCSGASALSRQTHPRDRRRRAGAGAGLWRSPAVWQSGRCTRR